MFKEQWWPLCLAAGTESQYPALRYYRREDRASIILRWWSHFLCLHDAGCFFPTRQAASATATSKAHLNLAKRVWQKETNQAASKHPEDEDTSILPTLCTRALVFMWEAMRLPYDTICHPPCFSAVNMSDRADVECQILVVNDDDNCAYHREWNTFLKGGIFSSKGNFIVKCFRLS